MTRIFQIGFQITGTRSLAEYFKNNNFKTFHWEKGKLAEQLFDNLKNDKTHFNKSYNGPFKGKQGIFYSDMEKGGLSVEKSIQLSGHKFFKLEGYKLFRALDNYYSDTLFILNLRDDWVKRKVQKQKGNKKSVINRRYASEEELEDFLKFNYDEHVKNVRNYFKGRNDFIEFNIQQENINKLTKWLKSKGFKIKYNKLPKIRG